MLLGVSRDDVMTEYLLTNEQLLPAVQPIMDTFAAAGGDPQLLRPVLGVEPDYLEMALDEMTATFGTFHAYLDRGLRLEPAVVEALRRDLIDVG